MSRIQYAQIRLFAISSIAAEPLAKFRGRAASKFLLGDLSSYFDWHTTVQITPILDKGDQIGHVLNFDVLFETDRHQ